MTSSSNRILSYLQDQHEEFVHFLYQLVNIESPSSVAAAQSPIFALLEQTLLKLNYKVNRIPGSRTGGCLYARPRRRNRGQAIQLLLGHCDTVWPLGAIQDMPVQIADGIMKGPGVFDMKAGLTQMIFALQTIKALKLKPPVTPVLLITSDEEIGSHESRHYIKHLSQRVNRVFVLEPALSLSGRLKTARKGVGHFEIRVTGIAAHAGIAPEQGASAILELSHIIQQLFALNDPKKGLTVNVGTIDGGVRANVIAPVSSASVDVRMLTAEDGQRVEQTIRNLKPTTPGVSLDIKGGIERLPMTRTARNQTLWFTAKELAEKIGIRLEQGTSGGASDGNLTSIHAATLDGLGAVGDGAHAQHEFVNIEKTIQRCALLTMLLLEPQEAYPEQDI